MTGTQKANGTKQKGDKGTAEAGGRAETVESRCRLGAYTRLRLLPESKATETREGRGCASVQTNHPNSQINNLLNFPQLNQEKSVPGSKINIQRQNLQESK